MDSERREAVQAEKCDTGQRRTFCAEIERRMRGKRFQFQYSILSSDVMWYCASTSFNGDGDVVSKSQLAAVAIPFSAIAKRFTTPKNSNTLEEQPVCSFQTQDEALPWLWQGIVLVVTMWAGVRRMATSEGRRGNNTLKK